MDCLTPLPRDCCLWQRRFIYGSLSTATKCTSTGHAVKSACHRVLCKGSEIPENGIAEGDDTAGKEIQVE